MSAAVVGLGYVGLPLAVELGTVRPTVGYDADRAKMAHYERGVDPSGQITADALRAASHLRFSSDPKALSTADYVIVAVPTPV
ncbi:MAG: Vi polysaccharide biosynthesis UDP-N-acetylglucosamine C-6 dehydrogenase TviB, partial [Acidiferrobacterales bacterium]|nr:Vi polysaccharide biosynthesis UDP-N-acetylglucosamine C-6 dehydrogenase TviB [Acidiferrobacterales bacterium]